MAVRVTADAPNRAEAEAILDFLRDQAGFLGGRVLPPRGADGRLYRVQTLHERMLDEYEAFLPEGCRVAEVSPGETQGRG